MSKEKNNTRKGSSLLGNGSFFAFENENTSKLCSILSKSPNVKNLTTLYEYSAALISQGSLGATKNEAIFGRLIADREMRNNSNTMVQRQGYANLYRSFTFLLAPYNVDCYWIALEWGRPYEKAFYLPRRSKLLKIIQVYQDILDDKVDVATISQPTGTGKSTLMIGFNTQLAGRFPHKSKFMTAYGDALCQSFYNGMLAFIEDDVEYCYKEIFPNLGSIETNAKRYEIDIGKTKKSRFPTLAARSIEAGFVGATRAQQLITMDDMIEDLPEAMNDARLEAKWNKVAIDLFGRMEGDCKILCQGTRYSVRDIIGRVQEAYSDKGDRMRVVEIPGLDENDESNFDFDCEFNYTTEWYRKRRDMMSEADFMTTVQQVPVEREGMLFAESSLQRFNTTPKNEEPDSIFAVIDPATGGGDYFAMPIIEVYGTDCYLVDVYFSREKTDVTIPQSAEMLARYKVSSVMLESNLESLLADDLEKHMEKHDFSCQIIKKRTMANKHTRIWESYHNIVKNFYFKNKSLYSQSDMYGIFMRQLCSYVYKKKNVHDDAPDSLAMAEVFIRGRNTGKVAVLKRTW